MSFEDKSIQCFDCGATFTFTVAEQELHQSKGYTNAPKRCPTCRQARKARQGTSDFDSRGDMRPSYSVRRQMYPAVCSQCGKATEVPFQPREGRPVYCSNCYNAVKPAR